MTKYVAGGQAVSRENVCFFQLFSTIKVNLVAKTMQRAYLCVIIHVNQLPFLAVLTWFLILGKIQDGGQDGHHYWWRHRPPAAPPFIRYTSSCWEDQRLFSEGKIASKYCSIPKALGRGPWPPPPPAYFSIKMRSEGPKKVFLETGPPSTLLLYHGGGYDFACTSEGQVVL